MLTTKVPTPGHYEVLKTPWAIDYVWMPAEEVEERLLEDILHPWRASYVEWVKGELTRSTRSGWSSSGLG